MSEMRKCDRCGQAFPPPKRGRIGLFAWNGFGDSPVGGLAKEVCPDCIEKFKVWLDRGELLGAERTQGTMITVNVSCDNAEEVVKAWAKALSEL